MSPLLLWLSLGLALAQDDDAPSAPDADVPPEVGEPAPAPAAEPEPAPEPEAAPEPLVDVPGAPEEDDDAIDVYGEWRVIGSALSNFPADADGTELGGRWLDHRLRAGTEGNVHPLVSVVAEADLAVGTVVSDPNPLANTPDERRRRSGSIIEPGGLIVRKLATTTTLGNVQLETGLVMSHWGLGMVANDGNTQPLFGRSDFGDRVLRVRATHLPTGPARKTTWLTTAALDLVIADEIATLRDGQLATQFIFSTLGLGRKGAQTGAYLVARQQWEAEVGRTTQAFVLDGYGDAWHEVSPEVKIRTAGEVAGVAGRTDRATTYQARERVGILALNATGIVSVSVQDDRIQAHFQTGYASGDGNPDDGVSHEFSFDRDFAVGMVGFDEVLAGLEAASWVQVNDPTIAGQPPDGSELLVSEGAFKRATFVAPTLQFAPHPWVDLRMGYAASWSSAYYAQPFTSARNGGVPTNHLEQAVDSRFLGGEFDWSVALMRPEGDPDSASDNRARYGLQLQGGHFGVGPALDGPGMPSTVNLLTLTGRVRW